MQVHANDVVHDFIAMDFANRGQARSKKLQNIVFYKVLPYVQDYDGCMSHPNMPAQLPQQTFSRWKTHWEKFGEPPYVTSKRKGLKRPSLQRITDAELEVLKIALDNNTITTNICG